jgi:glycerol-3-phosphate dehydrogenase
MPLTLEDMLARRTRALFLDARASEAIAPEVAWLMAQELGFDENWQKGQLEIYRDLIKSYF